MTAAEEFVKWLFDQLYDIDTSVDPWSFMPEQIEELTRRVERRYRIELEPM